MKLSLDHLGPQARQPLEAAVTAARDTGVRMALVGGAVRDILLGVPVKDIDLVAEGRVDEFAKRLADMLGSRLHAHAAFMTYRLPVPGLEPLDVVTARTETYPTPGALPLVSPATIEQDLGRRDFTLNCLGWDMLEGTLLDPMGGLEDLRRRQLRILHDQSFTDDPTRLFRLLRLAVRFRFSIESRTDALMKQAIADDATRTVSAARLRRELELALDDPAAPAIFAAFEASGLLDSVLGPPAAREHELESAWNIAPRVGGDPRKTLLAALNPDPTAVEGIETMWGPGHSARIARIRSDARRLEALMRRSTCRLRLARAAARVEPEALAFVDEAARTAIVRARDVARQLSIDAAALRKTGLPGRMIGRIVALTRATVAAGLVDAENANAFADERALKYLSARPRT